MTGEELQTQTHAVQRERAFAAVAATKQPVLVAVDFSAGSEAALLWACNYAESIGAPLEILHVIHDPAESPGTYRPTNGDPLMSMAEVAEGKLYAFLEQVGQDSPDLPGLETAKTICQQGLPGPTIVQVAQAHGAQHMVLGGRRHSGLARALRGSTASRVVDRSPLPITVVNVDN